MEVRMNWFVGYRKFAITIICIILLTTLLLSGYVEGKSFAIALSQIIVAFVTANGAEHLIGLGKEYINKNTKEK